MENFNPNPNKKNNKINKNSDAIQLDISFPEENIDSSIKFSKENILSKEELYELYKGNDNSGEYDRYRDIKENLNKKPKKENKVKIKSPKRPMTNEERIRRAIYRDNLK